MLKCRVYYNISMRTLEEINLRNYYPWYMEDVMAGVTEEVAEELLAASDNQGQPPCLPQ